MAAGAAVFWFFTQSPLRAQTFSASVESRRDRFTYHFDNPSSFDTPQPVPHFFEQKYVADNVWLVGRAAYTAAARWFTTAGVTASRSTTADDYDTFFNPDGSVIVAGTTGGIDMRSFMIGQRAEVARRGGLAVVAGYRLRIDRATFQLGHRTVARNGMLVEASDVTTREATSSQLHEPLAGVTLALDPHRRWALTIESEMAPIAVARLLVQLPDKYPGRDLVFIAKAGTVSARAMLSRPAGRVRLGATIDAGRTWSYRSNARFSNQTVAIGLTIAQ